jgi:hypothetical protein
VYLETARNAVCARAASFGAARESLGQAWARERAAREMGAPLGGPRCGDGWADESDDWVSRIVVRFDAMVTFLARSDSFLCGGADRWVNARNVLLAQIYTTPKVCFALLYLF